MIGASSSELAMSLQQLLDLSHLDSVAADEIALLVERAATEADAENLVRLTDLLLDRALRLLREGSREEILDGERGCLG